MKLPPITKIHNPKILKIAQTLPHTGKLSISPNHLLYLDIDDNYIHNLFPLLNDPAIVVPDYFDDDRAGAHISVIYPDELPNINSKNLGKNYSFTIQDVVSAQIHKKKYYVLLVDAPELAAIRKTHGLAKLLSFKGYSMAFHITFGTSP